MDASLNGLLRSRKVLLAALGVVTALVAYYTSTPAEVWAPIEALLIAVILGIAIEDGGEKASGSKVGK